MGIFGRLFGGENGTSTEKEKAELEARRNVDQANQAAGEAVKRDALKEVAERDPSWRDLDGSNYSEQNKALDAAIDRRLGGEQQTSIPHQPEAPAPSAATENPENKSAA